MPWPCPCGTSNPDGDRFCGGCGKQLAEVPASAPAPFPRWGKFLLILLGMIICLWISVRVFSGPRTSDNEQQTEGQATVTKAKYDGIQAGMSYDQVREIMGEPGEEISRSDIAGYSAVMYIWKNSNGSNMNATFQNGKLINKAQFGLP